MILIALFHICSAYSHLFGCSVCLQSELDWLECVGDMFTEEQNELVESAAEMLYGLIHARYILTSKGMASMVRFFCH